jgi:2-amino-4-hydroxy-6-hydroxymethyldihydropteridine diphosphokinase
LTVPARRALVGLGSNLGDRDATLFAALERLDAADGVTVARVSVIRTTAPVGGPPQPDFRNAAAVLETTLSPQALLALLLRVEAELGRKRDGERWGPRVVDLDLLLYDEEQVGEPDLVVPHPRMTERRFVLEPAVEIAPGMRHPGTGRTLAELLEDLA